MPLRLEKQAEGRLLAARVKVHGQTRAHAALGRELEHWVEEVRGLALSAGGAGIWIEKVEFVTHAELDWDALRVQDDALGALVRSLDATIADDAELLALSEELSELRRKLPIEIARGTDGLKLDDPAVLREIMGSVKSSLLPRLEHAEREEP